MLHRAIHTPVRSCLVTSFLVPVIAFAGSSAAADPSAEVKSDDIAPAILEEETAGEAELPDVDEDPWRFQLNPWLWMTRFDGDVGIGANVVDVDASFTDIIDASDSVFAFSGRLEIGRGKWGGYLDGFYSDLGFDNQVVPGAPGDTDVTLKQTILDFGIMYRVAEWEPRGTRAGNLRSTSIDLYAGGRYTSLQVDLDIDGGPFISKDEEWVDPIIGAKLAMPLDRRWYLNLSGDVGGFGVESDFTWSATGIIGYDFTFFDVPATAYGGYRAIGWDYSGGGDAVDVTWDMVQHGLLFGVAVRF